MVGQSWQKAPKDEEGNTKPPTNLFKIVLGGEKNVGKTAFLQRFGLNISEFVGLDC